MLLQATSLAIAPNNFFDSHCSGSQSVPHSARDYKTNSLTEELYIYIYEYLLKYYFEVGYECKLLDGVLSSAPKAFSLELARGFTAWASSLKLFSGRVRLEELEDISIRILERVVGHHDMLLNMITRTLINTIRNYSSTHNIQNIQHTPFTPDNNFPLKLNISNVMNTEYTETEPKSEEVARKLSFTPEELDMSGTKREQGERPKDNNYVQKDTVIEALKKMKIIGDKAFTEYMNNGNLHISHITPKKNIYIGPKPKYLKNTNNINTIQDEKNEQLIRKVKGITKLIHIEQNKENISHNRSRSVLKGNKSTSEYIYKRPTSRNASKPRLNIKTTHGIVQNIMHSGDKENIVVYSLDLSKVGRIKGEGEKSASRASKATEKHIQRVTKKYHHSTNSLGGSYIHNINTRNIRETALSARESRNKSRGPTDRTGALTSRVLNTNNIVNTRVIIYIYIYI